MSEPRTPEEALAWALPKVYTQWSNLAPEWEWQAEAILAALPERHRQAWADGLALDELRKAWPDDWVKVAVDLTFEPGHVALAVWPLDNHPRSGIPMRRARTLAEAADAVREALAR